MKTTPLAGDAGAAGVLDVLDNPLVLDFLHWLAAGPRPYAEVMDAWRTSCPRLQIWEDAVEAGLVIRRRPADREPIVELTPAGRDLVAVQRRLAAQVAA